MLRKILIAAAWAILGVIVFATLSPIGLRPHLGSVGVERFGAYAAVGMLFGLAYPRRFWTVLAMVAGIAVVLEAMQHLTPDRHGEPLDAAVKLAGGVVGVGVSFVLVRLFAAFAGASIQDRDPPAAI
ncbi:MAG: hypothetical protein JWR89_2309 [Tardiphaga sp.]|uniref:VanZ family protein n=1 Tax=Tardiphaga sp. TaxID=1926292 RepID=UPI002611CB8C|nr:VanZ family protein [Tardiphaga sp.]MDB5502407.1 hypothetical protein [Tardiphaga sp.]